MKRTLLLLEDNLEQLNYLEAMIEKYNQQFHGDFHVIPTASVEEAKGVVNALTPIDAFFLDVSMGTGLINDLGLDFAESLQSHTQYRSKPIIFITAYGSFLPTALNHIHCYAFLLKPYTEADLFHQLSDLCSKPKNTLTIKNRDGIYIKLSYNKLQYIQSHGRYIEYVSSDGSFYSRQHTLSELENILPNQFFRCHKSYIINLSMVVNYDLMNRYAQLESSTEKIPLSRKIKSDKIFKGAI